MSALQVQFNPETGYSIKDLDTLIVALETRVKAREVMHRKDAAEFLGISPRQLDYWTAEKVIPHHVLPSTTVKLYLRSELLQKIKAS
jgi:hypothetical protein